MLPGGLLQKALAQDKESAVLKMVKEQRTRKKPVLLSCSRLALYNAMMNNCELQ